MRKQRRVSSRTKGRKRQDVDSNPKFVVQHSADQVIVLAIDLEQPMLQPDLREDNDRNQRPNQCNVAAVLVSSKPGDDCSLLCPLFLTCVKPLNRA